MGGMNMNDDNDNLDFNPEEFNNHSSSLKPAWRKSSRTGSNSKPFSTFSSVSSSPTTMSRSNRKHKPPLLTTSTASTDDCSLINQRSMRSRTTVNNNTVQSRSRSTSNLASSSDSSFHQSPAALSSNTPQTSVSSTTTTTIVSNNTNKKNPREKIISISTPVKTKDTEVTNYGPRLNTSSPFSSSSSSPSSCQPTRRSRSEQPVSLASTQKSRTEYTHSSSQQSLSCSSSSGTTTIASSQSCFTKSGGSERTTGSPQQNDHSSPGLSSTSSRSLSQDSYGSRLEKPASVSTAQSVSSKGGSRSNRSATQGNTKSAKTLQGLATEKKKSRSTIRSSSSPPSSVSRRRRNHRRTGGWLNDDEDVRVTVRHQEENKRPTITTRKNHALHAAPRSLLCHSLNRPLTRTTTHDADDWAHNAGSRNNHHHLQQQQLQLVREEVVWSCTVFVGPNPKERLQAVTDLARLVAKASLSSSSSTQCSLMNLLLHEEVVHSLLSMLAFCKNWMLTHSNYSDGSEQKDGGDREEESLDPETVIKVKRRVAIMLHFLASSCCVDTEPAIRNCSSSGSSRRRKATTTARSVHALQPQHNQFRLRLLSSPEAMQGIMHLIRADPRIEQWHETTNKKQQDSIHSSSPSNQQCSLLLSTPSTVESLSSIGSLSSSASSSSNNNNSHHHASQTSNDPTRNGRRMKGRMNKRSRLSMIPEETTKKSSSTVTAKRKLNLDNDACDDIDMKFHHQGRRNNKRSHSVLQSVAKADADTDDDLSFPLTTTTSKATRNGSASTNYCVNGNTLIHTNQSDKTTKEMNTLIKKINNAETFIPHVHTCGHESDNDVCLELLPLLALSRLITGKREDHCTILSPRSSSTANDDEMQYSTFAGNQEREEETVLYNDEVVSNDDNDKNPIDTDAPLDDNDDDSHLVLQCNRRLGESGIIPLLADALVETMIAVVQMLRKHEKEYRKQPQQRHRSSSAMSKKNKKNNNNVDYCRGCLLHFQERVRLMVAIIDGACLFCDANRSAFCQSGYSAELGGYLIVGLVSALRVFGLHNHLFDNIGGAMVSETLRALLSLTHENAIAARELETVLMAAVLEDDHPNTDPSVINSPKRVSCLQVLAEVLYALSMAGDNYNHNHNNNNNNQGDSDDPDIGKHTSYDCSIFCLCIFTNYMESGGSMQMLSKIHLSRRSSSSSSSSSNDNASSMISFLPWLTKWLVEETSSFRDAVMESTFGTGSTTADISNPNKHAERTLQGNEGEKLVRAGNGFVLLVWILLMMNNDDDDDDSNHDCSADRLAIEAELPGIDSLAKMLFVRNTLKAFCNFSHASLGDFSVVIVDPVKKLIHQLEQKQEMMIRCPKQNLQAGSGV